MIDWHREGRSISASNSRTIEMASVLSEGREKNATDKGKKKHNYVHWKKKKKKKKKRYI